MDKNRRGAGGRALVGAAVVLAGCSKEEPRVGIERAPMGPSQGTTLPGNFTAPPAPPTQEEPQKPTQEWFGFEPYPGAELLCRAVTAAPPNLGGKGPREIHWATYASTSSTGEVLAFYKRRDAGVLEMDRDETTFAMSRAIKLSVLHLPTSQPFPRCEKPPRPDHKTLMVVSRAEYPPK